jgi:hypothetical protein
MKQGEIWEYIQPRPSRADDERTPYRVILSADYVLAAPQRWVLAAPIDNRDPDVLVSVPLGSGDPIPGWIRLDRIATLYRPWLKGPIGQVETSTVERISALLRATFDL